MKIRFILCLSAAMLALASPAQQPVAAKPATVKVETREVLLPVTVRDKKGALVTGLKISDFTLTEDGRPQTIKSLTRESNLPFRLGLLVETSRALSEALESERKAADKFVDTMLPEKPNDVPDQAFLIHFDREVELLEDFTASRVRLHHELDGMEPSRRTQDDARGPESGGSGGDERGGPPQGAGRGERGGGAQLYDAIYLASDELMKPKDGRKALVVFSSGVDQGSKMDLNDAVDAADRAGVAVYTIYFKGEQERPGAGRLPGGGHRGGLGWPGGGGGYPGGGGGNPGGGESKSQVDGKKVLEKIATRTGGRAFEAKKKDNLEEIYGQIAEELRGQYLLSYTPDAVDKDGGFHKIALKARKDGLTVATREGYYAPDGETK
jgi:VWFA-related protein